MEQGAKLYRYQGNLKDFEEAVHHLEHDHQHAPKEREFPLALDVAATWTRIRKLEDEFGKIRVANAGDDSRLLLGVYCIETELTLIYAIDPEQAPNGTILACFHNRQNETYLKERLVRSCFGEPIAELELLEKSYASELIAKLKARQNPEDGPQVIFPPCVA